MKKFIIFCSTAAIPFILVWMGFILTAFTFSPQEVFKGELFWSISIVYWFIWGLLIPTTLDIINKSFQKTKKKPNYYEEYIQYKNPKIN